MPGQTLVLIAGQSKAGTTSLFAALSRHPSVGASKLKELRFFLDTDYPLPAPARFNGRNLATFRDFCHDPTRPILLEASPDYFACRTPLKLPSHGCRAKAIVIVREPVSRLVSAYRFFQAEGLLPKHMSFEAYIGAQATPPVTPDTPVAFRALDQCRTSHYLPRWRAAYGDDLLVLDFDDVVQDPEGVMVRVCDFLGLESIPGLALDHRNAARLSRVPRLQRRVEAVRRRIAERCLKRPRLHRLLGTVWRGLNHGSRAAIPREPIVVPPHVRARIHTASAQP
ncbi:MAG: sulfotransferase domain-containing protein [Pseudomonadota bacterium]